MGFVIGVFSVLLATILVAVVCGAVWVCARILGIRRSLAPGARTSSLTFLAMVSCIFSYMAFGPLDSRTTLSPDGSKALRITISNRLDLERYAVSLRLGDRSSGQAIAKQKFTLRDVFIMDLQGGINVNWDTIVVRWPPAPGPDVATITFTEANFTIHLPSGRETCASETPW
jgi:hypothetical protein